VANNERTTRDDLPRGKKDESSEKFIEIRWHLLWQTIWSWLKWPTYVLCGILALVIISIPGCIYGRYTAPNDKQTVDTELVKKYEKLQSDNTKLQNENKKLQQKVSELEAKMPRPKAKYESAIEKLNDTKWVVKHPYGSAERLEPGSWSITKVEKLDGGMQYRVTGTCKHEVPGDSLVFEADMTLIVDATNGKAALTTVQTSPETGKGTRGVGNLQLGEDGMMFTGVWYGHAGYEAKKEAK